MHRVPYVDMAVQFAADRDALMAIAERVFADGMWVGGSDVDAFEAALTAYTGATHAVAVSSGTDALILALKALDIGPGDEVIVPPNSFIASAAAAVHVSATPVFADVLDDQNLDPSAVEAAITDRTRAIMPVHLTGRVCRMDEIGAIAERHDLRIVEDAAQSMGSKLAGRMAGTFGDVGCFSAHPLKNLNAMGDAGFALTDDAEVAARMRRLRNNGLADRDTVVEWGFVNRMDTFQAAVLTHRLGRLDQVVERRRAHVALYRELLDPAHVFWPPCRDDEFNTFHTFVVQVDRRDDLRAHLADNGVGSVIHYPVPIHLQQAATALGYAAGAFPVAERQAGRIVSLPVHQGLEPDDIRHVADTVNGFFR